MMMRYYEQIAFCPFCGEKYVDGDFDSNDMSFSCASCARRFYQNSIPSATVVIPAYSRADQILLLTRATEPHRGKLALPGGILRYGERPAEGARREVKEETLLDVSIERLLCETLVEYEYQGARLSVLELAFLSHPVDAEVRCQHTPEASSIGYYNVSELLHESFRLAFPEQRRVLEHYTIHELKLSARASMGRH